MGPGDFARLVKKTGSIRNYSGRITGHYFHRFRDMQEPLSVLHCQDLEFVVQDLIKIFFKIRNNQVFMEIVQFPRVNTSIRYTPLFSIFSAAEVPEGLLLVTR